MPFGRVFGALFFGGLCSWVGMRSMAAPALAAKLGGAFLVLTGLSLALALLRRRSWARWVGVAGALVIVAGILRMAPLVGDVADLLLLLAALSTAVLLALPASGKPREAGAQPEHEGRRGLGLIELGTAVGLAGLVTAMVSGGASPAPPGAKEPSPLPASAVARRIRWSDFGSGLQTARAENKPLLVTFVTSWCPYCTKMANTTWAAPRVVERMGGLVPVRVDAEEDREHNGFSGRALAQRYEVTGYPVQLLLDHDGRLISRADGYLNERELLSWIEREIRPSAADPSQAALRTGS